MKKVLIYLLISFFGTGISYPQNDTLFERFNLLSYSYLDKYQLLQDSTLLDSALYFTELGIMSNGEHIKLIGRKLLILSIKHEYDTCLNYIKTIKDPLFSSFPYYNKVLQNRFQAMKYLYAGDSIMFYKYVDSIIVEIKPYYIQNEDLFDTLCTKDLEIIFKNEQYFLFFQYNYYLSLIMDVNSFSNVLMTMKRKGYNTKCIDLLKLICSDNFLEYNLF